uniref:Uncharacterized protein n=1 Tax=Timema tahoe TaxID=61484 RepID=A0A7R9P0D9_9NEOP|nr:unnamed protein product [Timema tahoe]
MSPRTKAASGSPLLPHALVLIREYKRWGDGGEQDQSDMGGGTNKQLIAIVSMTILLAFPVGQVHKSLFAVWSKRDDLEIFAEEKIGLNGLVLRAATLQCREMSPHWLVPSQVPRITLLVTSANSSQHQILYGMFGEVWQVLEKKLNFTTQFVIPEDEAYGQSMSDGGWNGVVGMVMRQEVDVGVAPITMSLDRNDVIDFTIPLLMSNYVIMIRKPNKLVINWYGFLKPFGRDLWFMMIVIIVLVSTSNLLICKLANHYFVYNAEDLDLVGDICFSFFGILFCYQGMDRPPKSAPCRIVCVLTYLTAVVLLAAYSGSLISFITVKKTNLPFTNLEELYKDGSYQFGVVQSTSEDALFKEAKDPIHKKVYQNLMLPDAGNFVTGELEGLQRACEMDYAFLSSYEEVVDYFPKVNCTIVVLPHVLFKSAIALVLPKGSPYLNMFNNKINNLRLSGVMGRLYRRAWPWDEVSAEGEEETKVDMINVTPVFCILVGGILISILILVAEHLVHEIKWDGSIDVSPSDSPHTLHEILYNATVERNSLYATPTTPRRYSF